MMQLNTQTMRLGTNIGRSWGHTNIVPIRKSVASLRSSQKLRTLCYCADLSLSLQFWAVGGKLVIWINPRICKGYTLRRSYKSVPCIPVWHLACHLMMLYNTFLFQPTTIPKKIPSNFIKTIKIELCLIIWCRFYCPVKICSKTR